MGHLIVWNLSGWCVYNISLKIRGFLQKFVILKSMSLIMKKNVKEKKKRKKWHWVKHWRWLTNSKCIAQDKEFLTPTPKPQVSKIADKIMNFTTKNIQQYHILTNFYLPHSSSLLILIYFICVWFGNIILSWTWDESSQYLVMMASFNKWDTSLSGTLQAGWLNYC